MRTRLGCIFLLLGLSTVYAAAGELGKAGIVAWRPATGIWYVAQNGTDPEVTRQFGAPTDIPVVGDFDGDGITDFAVWRPSTGYWYIVYSSSGQVVTRQWGESTDTPVAGDFDGDGKTDIAVYRPSTGYWYVIQSSDGRVVTRQWGGPGDVPVLGDFDRDAKTDIAVFRPSTGFWYIVQSSNNLIVAKQWGQTGDVPVPADYDGWGEANVAVFRPSNGYWYIIQTDGEVVARQWGQTGDVPVSGDYDGDGIADLAVWRPSTGYWYIIQSSNGQVVTHQWGASTDVPVNNFVAVPGVGPRITGVGPNAVDAGGNGFQMTIIGANFDYESTVQWNGSVRDTAFRSSTELIATITQADVATQGSASITVMNFPGAATIVSNAVPFTVASPTAAASVTPLAQTISASSSPNTGQIYINDAFTIAVNGSTNSTYYYTASFLGTAVQSLGLGGTTTTNPPSGPVAGRITGPGPGATVTGSFTGPTPLNGPEIWLQSVATLGSGTFTDTITVNVCSDPQCAHPIPGSPITVPVTFTVTGNALPDTQFQMTNSLSFEATSTSSTSPVSTTLISSLNLPPSGAYVFTTLGSGGTLQSATVNSNLDGTATLTVTAKPPTVVGIGTYSDSIQVKICFDAACTKPAANFPMTIPITYLVDATPGVDFTVTNIEMELFDMAWNSTTQRIYGTANSDTGQLTGALVVINPVTQTVEHVVSLGADTIPTFLAISDAGQYAYIVDEVPNSVVRVNLSTLAVDETVTFPITSLSTGILAVPGQPNSFVANIENGNSSSLQIYDGTTPRPQAFNSTSPNLTVTWGSDASTLYAWDGQNLNVLSVSTNGLALAQTFANVPLDIGLQDVGGLIYLESGAVYDPITNRFQTSFALHNSDPTSQQVAGSAAIDISLNRAFYLTNDSQAQATNQGTLEGFNLTTRQSIWLARVPAEDGARFIRWGTNGVAYGTWALGIYYVTLISGPIVTR